ncbi:BlaI/MecI/CopY family transcriptional regulator [Rheinheimera riviphila]|uniref:BlaI/MecI/CopY family transcriptional regulator n=1 Tax=Rheinheimera riviphila TaxID=1834037 RepID=A0A437QMD9_9GAMM|nr:BlaI/MecI/CopY family transcriptional regulator [Rheinheimera riviphila]RVU35691.1 BlaI/MecI/CopY family transcriptional regulator [Rheinheimera riviphila]
MKDISPAELEVLKILWQQAPQTANQVVDALADASQWHEKTVKTLLNRLVSKGAVSFEKDGRAYLYSPVLQQQDYQYKESQSFIARVFAGRIAPLVAGFAASTTLQATDIDELKQLIADWEQAQQGTQDD